jgi:hypothetical protein
MNHDRRKLNTHVEIMSSDRISQSYKLSADKKKIGLDQLKKIQ